LKEFLWVIKTASMGKLSLALLLTLICLLGACGQDVPSISMVRPTDWPDVTAIFFDETETISVTAGERFFIRFDNRERDQFPDFEAVLDEDIVDSLGKTTTRDEKSPFLKTGWLCFEALKAGSIQVTVRQVTWHLSFDAGPRLVDQRVFKVVVTD
jgi:hypothetical protein